MQIPFKSANNDVDVIRHKRAILTYHRIVGSQLFVSKARPSGMHCAGIENAPSDEKRSNEDEKHLDYVGRNVFAQSSDDRVEKHAHYAKADQTPRQPLNLQLGRNVTSE